MRIGILGTGDVGKALGTAFTTLGHEVKMGSRSKNNESALAWAKENGPLASAGTFAETAAFGEIAMLATLGTAWESVLQSADPRNLRGKTLVDTTNPLEFSAGAPPALAISGHDSAGERVQDYLPETQVVKAFNTVGHLHMFQPRFPGGPPDMFICGNSMEAKTEMTRLIQDFGWGVIDIGGIQGSRYLEAMCLTWVLYAMSTDPPSWNHAFKMLKK